MEGMKYFIDTHDKQNQTFPDGITEDQLNDFYKVYEEACKEEGVISLKIHAGLQEGRAFCLNMAPSAEAVKKVHEKVGLPFDTITEVKSISSENL
jgi:hypothetical protein